jgi:hypothetical protein
MKDYYKILDLEEVATEAEVQARWIELTNRYQPDLGKTKDAGEKIQEINEAYEVLKNKSTRLEYDLKRTFKKRSYREALSLEEKRIKIQKIKLLAGILVCLLIVVLVVMRLFHVARSPKSEVVHQIDKVLEKKPSSQISSVKTLSKVHGEKEIPKEIKNEVIPQESKETVSMSPQRSPSVVEWESKQKEEPAQKSLPKSEMLVKKEDSKDITKEVPKEVPKEVQKEDSKEVTGVTPYPKENLKIKRKEEKKVAKEMSKVIPQESDQTDKPKSAVIEPQPVQKQEISVKDEKVASSPLTLLATEEEVKQFFSNYIDRYHRKDIGGFLSFFSSKAVQNQKDGLEGIKIIYTKFFDQSQELLYHLEDMKIMIYENGVDVKARFRVDQKLKKEGGGKTWKGNIHWVLIKEEGSLKVSSLDYQNDKSP